MVAEANEVKPRVRVPGGSRFLDEDSRVLDFIRADDLAGLAAYLSRTKPSLNHLMGARIEYLWKRKGSRSRGKAQLGNCQKASGLVGYYSESDFVVYLAADTCGTLTAEQIEAALFHQLSHIALKPVDPDAEDEEELVLASHDVEAFAAEVQEYGLWSPDLAAYDHQTRQLKLFGAHLATHGIESVSVEPVETGERAEIVAAEPDPELVSWAATLPDDTLRVVWAGRDHPVSRLRDPAARRVVEGELERRRRLADNAAEDLRAEHERAVQDGQSEPCDHCPPIDATNGAAVDGLIRRAEAEIAAR
jgi:hypothetical protein